MKKYKLISIVLLVLCMLLTAGRNTAKGATKEIKVEIHTVEGSGITEADVNDWIDITNEIDKPQVKFIVTSRHVYPPNSVYDVNSNDPCRINIWGVGTNPWSVPFPQIDPNVSALWGSVIILVPGDGTDIFIKDSTLAHELNHILGLGHVSDDPNNKMKPDNTTHGGTEPMHSCHRKDTQLTDEQRATMRLTDVSFAQDAMSNGRGGEVYDNVGDVSLNYIDLHWTQLWMERIGGRYIFHMTAQVDGLSFTNLSEIGFYIESDNNVLTGESPDGVDYYLAFQPFQPQTSQIIFQQYDLDLTSWVTLPPPPGVTYELTYAHPDSDLAPIPIGVKMDLDIELLIPGQTLRGNFAFKATATDYIERDLAPNTGLLRYSYPPFPIPGDLNLDNKVNAADLRLMTEQWPEIGSLRADIYPPSGDGLVQFSDFAVMANNWTVEAP